MSGPAWTRWLELLESRLGYALDDADDIALAERAFRGGQTPTQYARNVTGRRN